mmetsp:Transcript_68908/g.128662  ORF Transcript_68908/g.128662 Transcript_68908/m.128662 type:complete len:210 (-) Transcript_68908:73-702(-)
MPGGSRGRPAPCKPVGPKLNSDDCELGVGHMPDSESRTLSALATSTARARAFIAETAVFRSRDVELLEAPVADCAPADSGSTSEGSSALNGEVRSSCSCFPAVLSAACSVLPGDCWARRCRNEGRLVSLLLVERALIFGLKSSSSAVCWARGTCIGIATRCLRSSLGSRTAFAVKVGIDLASWLSNSSRQELNSFCTRVASYCDLVSPG